MRAAASCLLLGLLLSASACGTDEPAVAVDQADPVASEPAAPAAAVLTEASTGETVRLRIGDSMHVDLPADYVAPESSGAALRRESVRGGYPTGDPISAQFRASGAGTAELAAGTDFACLHEEPRCMLPQRSWTVSVVVTE